MSRAMLVARREMLEKERQEALAKARACTARLAVINKTIARMESKSERASLKERCAGGAPAASVRQLLLKGRAPAAKASRRRAQPAPAPQGPGAAAGPRSPGVTDKVHGIVVAVLEGMAADLARGSGGGDAPVGPRRVGAPRKEEKLVNGCAQCYRLLTNQVGGHAHECGLDRDERKMLIKELRLRMT